MFEVENQCQSKVRDSNQFPVDDVREEREVEVIDNQYPTKENLHRDWLVSKDKFPIDEKRKDQWKYSFRNCRSIFDRKSCHRSMSKSLGR